MIGIGALRPDRESSALEAALDDYLHLKSERSSQRMASIGPVLDRYIQVRDEIAKSNREHGGNFNPLVRLKIDETRHSRILGDFLDPEGSHGQGALFLLPFLAELGIAEPDKGVWHVTVETGRVDILIWRTSPVKSAVIIENKSNGAGDQLNQIYRYWHQEMFLWEPAFWKSADEVVIAKRKQNYHVVYLPMGEGKTPEAHSMERPVGLEHVNPFPTVPVECVILPLARLMEIWGRESAPAIPPTNERLRAFLSQYQELWTR